MITLIVLIALLVSAFFLDRKYDFIEDYLMIVVVIILMVCYLFVHSVLMAFVVYDYKVFKAERGAFEQTLNNSRRESNEYETAAIVKDVAKFNQKLAKMQYQNSTWFLDQYVDDRIDTLKPIE